METMVSIARSVTSSAVVVGCLLLLSTPAWAQEASGITGVVKDTSGAVLPGVTVEAASPALIEKVRIVVTDGEGRYNIIDLRPGTYSVTFSLSGFRTVRREGIQLPTGFTATVNGDLPVGSLEETITVSGAAPLVDTQNVRKQLVASRELLDTLLEKIPGVTVSTDMIVGFPGETAEDFADTLSLTRAAQYNSMFSFKYSPRPNTLASKRMPDDVSGDEKTARIVALQSLQREIQTRLHERLVGTTLEVLVDAASRRREAEISGRTTGNTVVNFPIPAGSEGRGPETWIGRTVPVMIRRAGPYSVWGEAAGTDPA